MRISHPIRSLCLVYDHHKKEFIYQTLLSNLAQTHSPQQTPLLINMYLYVILPDTIIKWNESPCCASLSPNYSSPSPTSRISSKEITTNSATPTLYQQQWEEEGEGLLQLQIVSMKLQRPHTWKHSFQHQIITRPQNCSESA